MLHCPPDVFFCPMPPHVLVDLVVLPPGHGRSVTDFWGWYAHEAQLRCPDYVSGDIGGCSARRALKPKFYQSTQPMVTAGILPFRENSHGRAGNRTRDFMISSQRLWPLDHEAGLSSGCARMFMQCLYLCSTLRYCFILLVYSVERQDGWLMINLKGLWRKWSWPDRNTLALFARSYSHCPYKNVQREYAQLFNLV